MPHTLFESSRIVALPNAAGTIIATTVNGTMVGTISAQDYEYHALVYAGTVANTGTMFVYALGGGGTTCLGSVISGSGVGNVVYEVKSDALVALGTQYNALGALIAVDAGGTWRGGAFWLSRWPRSAGTTPAACGWQTVGTSLF